jgi:aerobic carbon-monoxide dehydrogenase small subunit
MLIEFMVNGQKVKVDAPADMILLDLLRDRLGLTGTKKSCEIGECGSCSIILDGCLVNSCMVLALTVAGREVITIEGVCKPDGTPNDLQENFIDFGAVQCGFCTPGMILAGEALLMQTRRPTRREIREAISGNLCRCTGYRQIVDAIEATSKQRQKIQQAQEAI